MMLRFRVDELMKERGVTYREVSQQTNISTSTLYKLIKNKQQMIGLDVIERLLIYFDCQPNDLIVTVNQD